MSGFPNGGGTTYTAADSSITVNAGAKTLTTGSLDQIAAAHATAAAVAMNAQRLANLGAPTTALDSAGVLLYANTLSSPAASIDTGAAGIAAGFNVMVAHIIAQTTDVAIVANMKVTVNNDGSSIYDLQTITGVNVTASASIASALAFWQFQTHGASGTSGYPGVGTLTFPGYANTSFNKTGTLVLGNMDATAADNAVNSFILGYRSTTAISRMKVAPSNAVNLATGSALYIYGF